MDTNGKDGQTRRYKTSSTGSKKPKKQLNKEETRVIGTDRVKMERNNLNLDIQE